MILLNERYVAQQFLVSQDNELSNPRFAPSESLKSESSLYLLEPPPKHPLSNGSLSANSSTISLSQRTPLPPSPPLTHPLRKVTSPTLTPPGYVPRLSPPGAVVPSFGTREANYLLYRYLESNRPATTITYTFAPQTIPSNSMILSAPAYTSPPQEPYYISVNMNCFTPTSYITIIRRGSWEGKIVGDFEYVFWPLQYSIGVGRY